MQATRIAALAVLALATVALKAQETRGGIFGRVLDPSSAPVAAAAVTVTNTDTNVNYRLVTNETGYFEANLLLPGNYQLSAEATGFKRSVRRGVVLPVSTRLEIDLVLEIGAVAETVEVTAAALPWPRRARTPSN